MAGDLDHATADDLRRKALGALSDGAVSLVLDCSELTFIDSTGLSVLIEANDAAAAQSGTVTVRNPPNLMLRLLHATRLDEVLVIQNVPSHPAQD